MWQWFFSNLVSSVKIFIMNRLLKFAAESKQQQFEIKSDLKFNHNLNLQSVFSFKYTSLCTSWEKSEEIVGGLERLLLDKGLKKSDLLS